MFLYIWSTLRDSVFWGIRCRRRLSLEYFYVRAEFEYLEVGCLYKIAILKALITRDQALLRPFLSSFGLPQIAHFIHLAS